MRWSPSPLDTDQAEVFWCLPCILPPWPLCPVPEFIVLWTIVSVYTAFSTMLVITSFMTQLKPHFPEIFPAPWPQLVFLFPQLARPWFLWIISMCGLQDPREQAVCLTQRGRQQSLVLKSSFWDFYLNLTDSNFWLCRKQAVWLWASLISLCPRSLICKGEKIVSTA
jgi:hypothetical protein